MWFYFDVLDGEELRLDDVGVECESPEVARREAQRALGEMMKDALPDGDEKVLMIRVRDESNETVLMVSLVMRMEQVGHGGPA